MHVNPQIIQIVINSCNQLRLQIMELEKLSNPVKSNVKKNVVYLLEFEKYKFKITSTFPSYNRHQQSIFIDIAIAKQHITIAGDVMNDNLTFNDVIFHHNLKDEFFVTVAYMCMCMLCVLHSKFIIEINIPRDDRDIIPLFEKLGFIVKYKNQPTVLQVSIPVVNEILHIES